MRRLSLLRAVFRSGLVLPALAGAGCISITRRNSLVDLGGRRWVLAGAESEGSGTALVAAVGVACAAGAALGWFVAHRRRARPEDTTPVPPPASVPSAAEGPAPRAAKTVSPGRPRPDIV